MNKVLLIVGTTASGKTSLAWELAARFNGELISADSRQIYRGMDIVTGKDIPAGASFVTEKKSNHGFQIGYYQTPLGRIWGHDAVNPDQEWNAVYFASLAKEIIPDLHAKGKLPILVGGTGWYLQALLNPPPSLHIPPNPRLRQDLQQQTPKQLYDQLYALDSTRAANMNNSDRQNPYRLIRAIEVHLASLTKKTDTDTPKWNTRWIGVTFQNRQKLYQQIDQRVQERLLPGIEETKKLASQYPSSVLNRTIGYTQILSFLNSQSTQEQLFDQWRFAEHAYARRQLTWFKKQSTIRWFYTDTENTKFSIGSEVASWYSQT